MVLWQWVPCKGSWALRPLLPPPVACTSVCALIRGGMHPTTSAHTSMLASHGGFRCSPSAQAVRCLPIAVCHAFPRRPYDAYDELAVRVLLQFAASGKSLLLVGPDVMSREFYPDADSTQPPVTGPPGGDTPLASFRVPQRGASEAGDDEGETAGLPQLVRRRGRQLLQAGRPSFNASSIPVSRRVRMGFHCDRCNAAQRNPSP